MHANAMPHSELNMATINHRQHVVLCLGHFIRAGEFQDRVPLVNDRRTSDTLNHQFRLKEPSGVLQE